MQWWFLNSWFWSKPIALVNDSDIQYTNPKHIGNCISQKHNYIFFFSRFIRNCMHCRTLVYTKNTIMNALSRVIVRSWRILTFQQFVSVFFDLFQDIWFIAQKKWFNITLLSWLHWVCGCGSNLERSQASGYRSSFMKHIFLCLCIIYIHWKICNHICTFIYCLAHSPDASCMPFLLHKVLMLLHGLTSPFL